MPPLAQHGFRMLGTVQCELTSTHLTNKVARHAISSITYQVRFGTRRTAYSWLRYQGSEGNYFRLWSTAARHSSTTTAICRNDEPKKSEEQKREEEQVMMKLGLKFPEEKPKLEDPPVELVKEEFPATTPLNHLPPLSASTEVASNLAKESLPSHRERKRSKLMKRLHVLMEEWQQELAVIGQKVNTYTGTDYTGIQLLRQEIIEQEKIVRSKRQTIVDTKQALDTAQAQQATSQKEVVGLLERKHSWTPTDLERYMSLVRSEHVNDQAVQAAKDRVFDAEQALEEARSHLEKRERMQYHEEQIWSDTIRRNSTWITFGLMGFNILLLLLSLAILEPWRRRRLVREIRTALEEHKPVVVPTPELVLASPIEAELDAAAEPANDIPESTVPEISGGDPSVSDISPTVPDTVDHVASVEPPTTEVPLAEPQPEPRTPADYKEQGASAMRGYWYDLRSYLSDFFSDRPVTMLRRDATVQALQCFSAGAALIGMFMILLKPN